MKNIPNDSLLSGKLKAYAAMAGAIAGFAPASQAGIIYTDVDPDESFSNHNDFYSLDLNNDGTDDFEIRLSKHKSSYTGPSTWYFRNYNVGIRPLGNNSVQTDQFQVTTTSGTSYQEFAVPNNVNDPINAQANWANSYILNLCYLNSYQGSGSLYGGPAGPWLGQVDKYVGLKLEFGGQHFYGWARLDVGLESDSFVVKDYAYENFANKEILAGDTIVFPTDPVQNVSAADVDDKGNGADMEVSFDKAPDENRVAGYRIIVVKSADAATFDEEAAGLVTPGNYVPIAKTGSNIIHNMGRNAKDKDGDDIRNGLPYKIFVLSEADGNLTTSHALSAPSGNFTLNAPSDVALNVTAEDVADNEDASDLKVSFEKALNEEKIALYRIMVVKASKAANFVDAAAEAVPAGNYTSLSKTGNNIEHTMASHALDTDGDAILNDVAYKVFVFSIADGLNATLNMLSEPSEEITLTKAPPSGIAAYPSGTPGIYNDRHNLYIRFTDPAYLGAEVQVHNAIGQTLYSGKLSAFHTSIPRPVNENGILIVQLRSGPEIFTKKVF